MTFTAIRPLFGVGNETSLFSVAMRFYMGTIWISQRADLTPVYAMIFRRLKPIGADWVYHFPELGLVEFAPADDMDKPGEGYSVSLAAAAELEAQKRHD
jgi:hypothetical protein